MAHSSPTTPTMGLAQRLTTNATYSFVAGLVSSLVALLLGIALARGLGPERYGGYAYFMWLMSLGLMITHFGMGPVATKYISEAVGRQNLSYIQAITSLVLRVRGSAALILSLAALFLALPLARFFGQEAYSIYFTLAAIGLLPYVLFFTLQAILAGFQRYDYSAYLTLLIHLLRAPACLALLALGVGVIPLLWANIGAWLLAMLTGAFLLFRLVPWRGLLNSRPLEPETRERVVRYVVFAAGTMATSYFLSHGGETFWLGRYRTITEVGLYSVAFSIPTLVMGLVGGPWGVLLPAISEQFGRGDLDKIRAIYTHSSRYIAILASLAGMLGIALSKTFVLSVYGPEYAGAVAPMQILFLGMFALAFQGSASAVLWGMDRPSLILKVEAFLAALSLGLGWLLVPTYGVLGAAVASSIPRVLVMPPLIWLVYRHIGACPPLRKMVKLGFLTVSITLFMLALQEYLPGNYGLLISTGIGVSAYALGIIFLGVIYPEDIAFLKQIQANFPPGWRKRFVSILALLAQQVGAPVQRSPGKQREVRK